MAVIKVQPWGEGQGDHVLIEEEDFNPDFHKLLEDKKSNRDLLLGKAAELGLEFDEKITNKDLKALIEVKEAELKAAE